MRLNRLELAAFGHFSETILDLSQGKQGLHLILGPNEAGKSTALRAIHHLFFGIPARTTDSFLHPPNKLLIKALLELKNGDTLFCQRRKGIKNTLLNQDGSPLLTSEAARFMELVPESTFKSIFSTSHEELRQGGKLIATGQGDLGQALFAAGTGGLGMRNLIQELEDQAGAIFKPTNAKKPVLNNLLIQYYDQIKKAQKAILKPEDYEEQVLIQGEALKKLEHLKKDIREASSRLSQYERIEKTQPLVAALLQAETDFKALPRSPKLDPEFRERRRETQKEIKDAKAQKAVLTAEVESLKQRLSDLLPDVAVLQKAGAVESIFRDLGKYQQNLSELPSQQAFLKEKDFQAQELCQELGVRPDSMRQNLPLPGVTQRERLQELSEEEQILENRLNSALSKVNELKIEQTRLKERHKSLPPGLKLAPELGIALSQAREQGDLGAAVSEAQKRVDELKENTSRSVDDLRFFQGCREKLYKYTPPYEETAIEHESLMQELKRGKDSLVQTKEQLFSELSDLTAEIETLTLHGTALAVEDLLQARQNREHGWRLIKKTWLHGSGDPEAEQKFKGSLSLDKAYEATVRQADQIADRLFAESEKVTRLLDRKARQKNCIERLNELKRKEKALDKEAEDAWQNWVNLWSPLLAEVGTPKEMQRWLRDFQKIKDFNQELERAQKKLIELKKTKEFHQNELNNILNRIQGPLFSSGLDWQALIKTAEELYSSLLKAGQDKKNTSERSRETDEQLKEAQSEEEAYRKKLDEWQRKWVQALDQAGLNPELTVRQALAELNTRAELSQTLFQANKAREKIEDLNQKNMDYQKKVRKLCLDISPWLADKKTEDAVEALNRLLADTKTAHTQKKALTEQLQEKETLLKGLDARLDRAGRVLAELVEQAEVEKEEDLPEAEETWRNHQEIQYNIKELTQSLLSHSSPGMGLDQLRAEAAQVDADELPGLKAEMQGQLDNLEEQRSAEQEIAAQAKLRLAQMNDQIGAAQARQEAGNLLSEARDQAEEYIKILLAHNLLKMEMERYLKENQKPLLEKASEYFRELTGGSFSGLAMGYDEKDNPILMGLRQADSRDKLPVQAMSDGACDQLYLSLRLAALELHLAAREPFPFIMDDALVHFDDQRAARALSALARLSSQTQVIFFTHHRHMEELASQVAQNEGLFVHHL
jgi:uncharacterized protein YhaN